MPAIQPGEKSQSLWLVNNIQGKMHDLILLRLELWLRNRCWILRKYTI